MVFTHDSSINTVLKLEYGGHCILQVHGVCLLQILRFLEIQFLTVVWLYGSGDYDNNTQRSSFLAKKHSYSLICVNFYFVC